MMRLLVTLLFGALAPFATAQTFTDASELLPESSAEAFGASIADADGDGRLDLVGPDRLFLQRDGGFESIPFEGEIPLGSAFGDVDGDGRAEALILYASMPELYSFDPARQRYVELLGGGIDTQIQLVQGSVLFDYDRDGEIDVLIGDDGDVDKLYRGLGKGVFEEVSSLLPQLPRGDYGVAAADYDRDGDDDVYVGLCVGKMENLLYENMGGAFVERAPEAGIDDARPSWGIVWADIDNDGWLDLFVTNMPLGPFEGTNGLFRNNADGTFTDIAVQAGVAGPADEDSWNVTAADFDNDGWVDFFVGNRPEPSRLYRNNGDGTFSDITTAAGIPALSGLPLASGDVDGDGWVDLFTPGGVGASGSFLLNDGGSNGWLSVDLVGIASNPDGIGARVEVTTVDLSMVREITSGDGMMSQSHGLRAHFGLGTAATADITVRWPSGTVDVLEGVAASQALTVVEGVGPNAPPTMFGLTSPAEGAVVPLGEPVTLVWEAAEDDEAVSYTVHLAAPDGTDATFETEATSFEIPASALEAEGPYQWAVVARDAYSARTSLDNASFTNNPNVSNEPALERTVLALEVWPNPVRETATARFTLAAAQSVRLEVYDTLGRRVQQRDLGRRSAGAHSETLDMSGLGVGAYFVRLVGAVGARATASLVRVE